METKINLYEVPVTEVQTIVMNVMAKANELATDYEEYNPDCSKLWALLTYCQESDYKLPFKDMFHYMVGNITTEQLEERVINYATEEYHKKIAS